MIALMFLGAVSLYVVMGGFIVKRVPNKWGKGIAIAILILIPTGDSIVGHLYFSYLCSSQAGVKVYQTVELPSGYWDKQGKPRFYVNRYGRNNLRFIFPDKRMINAPGFEYTWVTTTYSGLFHIDKDVLQISDRENGRILGQYFLFRYWDGWLARNFSPHNSATGCKANDLNGWELKIFKPVISVR